MSCCLSRLSFPIDYFLLPSGSLVSASPRHGRRIGVIHSPGFCPGVGDVPLDADVAGC